MPLLALALQSAEEGQVAAIARTFGVDWPHLFAQTVSFSIVCALLYWLAYRPVLRMLDARREQITQGLANTEKINAALAAIEDTRRQTLATAQAEATRVIAEARDVAGRLRDVELEKAAAAAEHILRSARQSAARERTRMLADIRRDVGRLVVKTTAAVTGKILTPDDHRRLAEEASRQLS
jgi:F-type H+-transporting ATPase subunit b